MVNSNSDVPVTTSRLISVHSYPCQSTLIKSYQLQFTAMLPESFQSITDKTNLTWSIFIHLSLPIYDRKRETMHNNQRKVCVICLGVDLAKMLFACQIKHSFTSSHWKVLPLHFRPEHFFFFPERRFSIHFYWIKK